MSVEREERERRREHRARVAIRGGRDEHRGDGAASECLAPIPLRQQGGTGHVAGTAPTEPNSTTPRASAVGGIAAFSAGVRSIGAGSQWVRATSAAPANTATTG